jgi:hypothetical protein
MRIVYRGAQVESVFAGLLAARCRSASSFFWAPWWCDFEGGGRDKLPWLEDFKKELSFGGSIGDMLPPSRRTEWL